MTVQPAGLFALGAWLGRNLTGGVGIVALIVAFAAFTIHTSYKVRDWGKSYLDTEMPTDLAGRAECAL